MGICYSKSDIEYSAINETCKKVSDAETVEVNSPFVQGIRRRLSSISVPVLKQVTLLTQLGINCPKSTTTMKRDPSRSSSRRRSEPSAMKRVVSFSNNLLAYTPSMTRSKSFDTSVNSGEFNWDCMTATLRSDTTAESTPGRGRRSLSSLLREFVEEEQILFAKLLGQVATPRARQTSACIIE